MPVIWSIWLKFDSVKSVQVIAPPITNQTAKNSIQLSRSPFLARVAYATRQPSLFRSFRMGSIEGVSILVVEYWTYALNQVQDYLSTTSWRAFDYTSIQEVSIVLTGVDFP